MSVKQLTTEQQEKIKKIKEDWKEAVDRIPEDDLKGFHHIKATKPYVDLQEKYMDQIREVSNS